MMQICYVSSLIEVTQIWKEGSMPQKGTVYVVLLSVHLEHARKYSDCVATERKLTDYGGS